ncbi:chloramphenicol phosphotransferase CPT family protein [Anaerocolumna sp. MB42-C2]|uniref:chloramphenicol phosphotransferase CPT family protein n=1 Tax=Anaerocolumna sp. MB42-C2 TaxID=3070997 RepID=UPI0027E11B0F|nr:AAA family ATPase [Anaerocolumna sp. MB42-C2]WMJ88690.1 AAA family ATPase [Anaerocolumna sp. MB42-C2]
MEFGKIILLNGVSSSGKTTLAKELQKVLQEPYFHLSYDTFFFMMPQKYFGYDNEVCESMINLLHNCIVTFTKLKANVIIDHVFYKKSMLLDCINLLKDYPVLFVGVHCPLNELERREKERGNRRVGQAKEQLEFFHKNEIYDIEVDTFNNTISECAQLITDKLVTYEFSKAFTEMYDRYKNEII